MRDGTQRQEWQDGAGHRLRETARGTVSRRDRRWRGTLPVHLAGQESTRTLGEYADQQDLTPMQGRKRGLRQYTEPLHRGRQP